jgi:uncharacterized heparinase superfamily protein
LKVLIQNLKKGANSGYRKYKSNGMEIIFDAGKIGADYQPGHAHADTFTYCLYFEKSPIIVDTGTNTYENNERRLIERSTNSHNTVTHNNLNSSEVWFSFRVGNRANSSLLIDNSDYIKVIHDGYKGLGVFHERTLEKINNGFKIIDKIKNHGGKTSTSNILFHPNYKIDIYQNRLIINNLLMLKFSGFINHEIISYKYAAGYNNLVPSRKWVGYFKSSSMVYYTIIKK